MPRLVTSSWSWWPTRQKADYSSTLLPSSLKQSPKEPPSFSRIPVSRAIRWIALAVSACFILLAFVRCYEGVYGNQLHKPDEPFFGDELYDGGVLAAFKKAATTAPVSGDGPAGVLVENGIGAAVGNIN